MNWTFIVIRDNTVEQIKSFGDFWAGCEYTDNSNNPLYGWLKYE